MLAYRAHSWPAAELGLGLQPPYFHFTVLPVTHSHTPRAQNPHPAVVHPTYKCLWRKQVQVTLTVALRTLPLRPDLKLFCCGSKHFLLCLQRKVKAAVAKEGKMRWRCDRQEEVRAVLCISIKTKPALKFGGILCLNEGCH